MNYQNGNFIQYNDNVRKKETKSIALYLITHITIYVLLIFFFIFFVWYTVFTTTHRFYAVEGSSMKPLLNATIDDLDSTTALDAVYIDLYSKNKVGDIVIVEGVENKNIIKRLMATAGDLITIAKDGDSYYFYRIAKEDITNEQFILDEDAKLVESLSTTGYTIEYNKWSTTSGVNSNGFTYDISFYNCFLYQRNDNYNYYTSESGLVYVQVPEGKVFCMGDNRHYSKDSRTYGFFSTNQVVGHVEFIVYNYSFVNRIGEVVKFYYQQVEEFFAR